MSRGGRPVGRYAPSPTGDLHLGNLRTALLAHAQMREMGGIFIMRIEDIDTPRTVPGSEERMLDDMRWLGIDWDEGPDIGGPAGPYRQSERAEFYEAALASLGDAGRLYLCTCSRKDLQESSAPHGSDGVVYKGNCRNADPDAQRQHPEGAAVRLAVDAVPVIMFHDAAAGTHKEDLRGTTGDFIVRRRDGLWAYQLACAVDDALMGVTHVLRGADLFGSTARQIAIMWALGLPVPEYSHVPLVADSEGRRMSKRDGSMSLQSLRQQGMTPAEAREAILGAPMVGGLG